MPRGAFSTTITGSLNMCFGLQGYRDALCGACADTHGRTRSLKCAQCHSQHVNVLMYGLSLVLLLFLSSFGIKSNLTSQRLTISVTSRSRSRSFRLHPILSSRYIEMNDTDPSDGEIRAETDDLPRRQEVDIESARQRVEKLKQRITEIFKASRTDARFLIRSLLPCRSRSTSSK